MADERFIHDLTLVPLDGTRTVIFRRRTPTSTLDERVRAIVVAYRTFVADGQIYTDVLVEDMAGVQEFVALQKVTFMKRASDIPSPKTTSTTAAQLVPPTGF